jgi:hypothetical protein
LCQYLHLLRHRDGMAWEGLCDGRPEQYVLCAQSGSSKDAEGIGTTGSGAREPRRWDTLLF